MSKEAKFKWHGIRPVDNGEIEEFCRADMRENGVKMHKPHKLIFSTVMLTADFYGPSVTVWGKKGSDKFHAAYMHKTEWCSLTEEELGGAA